MSVENTLEQTIVFIDKSIVAHDFWLVAFLFSCDWF